MPINVRNAVLPGLGAALMLVGGLAVAAPAPESAVNVSARLDAARRESQILTGFQLSPHLRDIGLSVHVDGNKAVLDGVVDSSVAKELADQIAHGADGIKFVDDRIVVNEMLVTPERVHSERTFAEVLDDATISASVKYKLIWNAKTDALGIHVETGNGEVTLAGAAQTSEEKALAGRIARNTEGVLGVTNNIKVAGATGEAGLSKPAVVAAAPAKASDAWITTKVKSSLMFTRGTDVFRITVSTLNGVVSLAGIVDTVAERDLVVEVAGDVRGVKRVDSTGLKAG
ncbi:MAG: BON domain-containing protein [Dokdonella sp.]